MKAKITFDDGKEVELSKETTDKLRAKLVKPEPFVVDYFTARFPDNKSNHGLFLKLSNGDSLYFYDSEIHKIIEGLTRMMEEHPNHG